MGEQAPRFESNLWPLPLSDRSRPSSLSFKEKYKYMYM